MPSPEYSIYCDESCHLPNDSSTVMALGAVWCPVNKRKEIFSRIKEIKEKNKINTKFEIKWNKVSPAKVNFYLEIIDFFFDDDDLHFRGLVVPDKRKLNHTAFNQDHDTFYYKMYFDLIKVVLNPENKFNIYIDIKDTQSQEKVLKLKEVLSNSHYDYHNKMIRRIQQIHSHEVSILQIADLLIGAVTYHHRRLKTSQAKLKLIARIKDRSGYSLERSTLVKENKFNLFIWSPQVL